MDKTIVEINAAPIERKNLRPPKGMKTEQNRNLKLATSDGITEDPDLLVIQPRVDRLHHRGKSHSWDGNLRISQGCRNE